MTLSTPQAVQERLEQLDAELAVRQNTYEDAALAWFKAKREREHRFAEEFVRADGSVADRKAKADLASCQIGQEEEAAFEAAKAGFRVRETRATIGQSILRSQGRS